MLIHRSDVRANSALAQHHRRHDCSFRDADAFASRVSYQCVVEIGATDLVAMGVFVVKARRKVIRYTLAGLVGYEFRAGLGDTHRGNFTTQTEPLQDWQIAREKRFTDCLLYTSDAADDLLCVDLGG